MKATKINPDTHSIGRRYGMRPPQVAYAIGSVELLRRARFHRWIMPVVEQKRLTIFDSGDVAILWQRIRAGEIPPAVPRKPVLGIESNPHRK